MNANANWNSSQIAVNMTSDKVDLALAILSDMALNPAFSNDEIELYKKQTLDELIVRLKQPNNLASYVASRYTYGEHPALGTPDSLKLINQANIQKFYKDFYVPKGSVLIFTGDISAANAFSLADKYFGKWNNIGNTVSRSEMRKTTGTTNLINRLLVVDLPNSGQAAVTYAKQIPFGRLADKEKYFSAMVGNTVLGGGYSARLNEEIRIKRGLSYGASSGIVWRNGEGNFIARAQTKNVSAAEVAELMAGEVNKIVSENAMTDELTARKLTLTGDFGRDLASTDSLAERVGELYLFGLKTDELSSYMKNVQIVSDAQIKDFAVKNLKGGDLIIVGDYSVFKDDLAKRFPNMKIDVIKADELDLSKDNLRK
ncbi:MAG: pitrilysin family protein [Actinomycetota bacterium]